MASQKLKDMLNDAIAREISVSIQYMWQHVQIKGLTAEAVGGTLRTIAMAEMLHAERIAERLDYLGGEPTTKPANIEIGKSAEEMLGLDVAAEEEAIEMYREIISLAGEEGDPTTRQLFEQILAEEEGHHDTFRTLLGV
jgi:bacterioferritin